MTGCRPGFVSFDHRTVTFRTARDCTRERSSVGGLRHCAHDHLMRQSQTLLLLAHFSGCRGSCPSQKQAIGHLNTHGLHSSGQVLPSATGRRAVVVGGKRREGGSIWIHAVFRRSHGLCCFSMIMTAKPDAMVATGQAVVNYYTHARRP